SMTARWAALIANAANPVAALPVPPSFPEILKQLSPQEAMILDNLYDVQRPGYDRTQYAKSRVGAVRGASLSAKSAEVAVDNLDRLGLCLKTGIRASEPNDPSEVNDLPIDPMVLAIS